MGEEASQEASEEASQEASQEAPEAAPEETVLITAFTPRSVDGAEEFMVNLWVHRSGEEAALAAEEAAEERHKAQSKRGLRVPRGARVEAVVASCSAGLEALTADDHIPAWSGAERANMCFVIASSVKSSKPLFVRFRLKVDGQDFGQLPVLVRTAGPRTTASRACGESPLWLYPSGAPHVFLSYRRAHQDLADRVRLYMERDYGYRVFMDTSPESGLTVGDFQQQLEGSLARAKVVIPLLTPAPSGTDARRRALSYLGCVKDSAAAGQTDWCYRELQLATQGYAQGSKILVPVFRGVDISRELSGLPEDIAPLGSVQAIELFDSYFADGIARIHKGLQRRLGQLQEQEASL